MTILAIDTGLNSLGWATAKDGRVLSCGAGLFPALDGESVHDGYVRRVTAQVNLMVPGIRSVRAVYAESLSFARSSKAVAAVSLCWGWLVAVCHEHSVPLFGIAPKRWQHALQGHKRKVDQAALAARIERYVSNDAHVAAHIRRLTAQEKPHALDACGLALFVVKRKAKRG